MSDTKMFELNKNECETLLAALDSYLWRLEEVKAEDAELIRHAAEIHDMRDMFTDAFPEEINEQQRQVETPLFPRGMGLGTKNLESNP